MTLLFFFFFQAEDGIRDLTVTGVQTCALPISWKGPVTRYTPICFPVSFIGSREGWAILGTFNSTTASTFICGLRNCPGLFHKAIRNSPTTLICLWSRGAQLPVFQAPQSKWQTPTMTCTPTVLRLAQ